MQRRNAAAPVYPCTGYMSSSTIGHISPAKWKLHAMADAPWSWGSIQHWLAPAAVPAQACTACLQKCGRCGSITAMLQHWTPLTNRV